MNSHSTVPPPPSLSRPATLYTTGKNSNIFTVRDELGRVNAYKVLRLAHMGQDQKHRINQDLSVLIAGLQHMYHPNVVHHEEITFDLSTTSSVLKMPFFSNGNIVEYLSHMSVGFPVTEATRLQLIAELSGGLSFLHHHEIVHGNIRGSNVLIDANGHAVLVDAAVSTTILRARHYVPILDNIEWMAPELFPWNAHPDNHAPVWTKESDMYAFARTVEEIYSLRSPFAHIGARNRVQLYLRLKAIIMQPPLPHVGISPWMWDLLEGCLAVWPQVRPSSSSLYDRLLEHL